MTDFLIATNNSHKVLEFKRILLPIGINVISAEEAGVDLGEVSEDGDTFEKNAFIKASSAYKLSGLPCIADDSGLCVDALDGAPGVYSARFGGEDISQSERTDLLLEKLEGVPFDKRTARFVSSICCILGDDDIIEVRGECEGFISFEPMGEGGFGYDPVFMLDDGRSFGELSGEEKDKYSHRGVALRMLRDRLSERKDVL